MQITLLSASYTPGPYARLPSVRNGRVTTVPAGNTVSKCPMRSRCGPRPGISGREGGRGGGGAGFLGGGGGSITQIVVFADNGCTKEEMKMVNETKKGVSLLHR